jgi:uncharacterized membrane protein
MRGIYRFLKSTMIGGLVVLLPVVVLVAIVGWAVDLAVKVVEPLFARLPDKSVGGVSLVVLIAVVGVILACFLAGIVAETALVRGLGNRAERLALLVPGYALMKRVGADLIGVEGKRPVRTVLVRFQASCQIGFLMETLPDGQHVVFVPGVPKALVGTLHIVEPDRVRVLSMSVSAALDALGRLGVGLGEVWGKESQPSFVVKTPTDGPIAATSSSSRA